MTMFALAIAALLGVPQGGTEIRGTVVDESGKPAKGAEVFVSRRSLEADGTVELVGRATADEEGRFELRASAGGTRDWWFVWTDKEGFGLGLSSVREPTEEGQDVPSVALGLRPEARRTVTVKDHDGRPVAGAEIGPYFVSRTDIRPGRAKVPEALSERLGETTDAQGRATVRGLAKGDRLMAVRVKIPGLGSQVVDLAQYRSESVTLELPAFGRLLGSVLRPDGSPMKDVEVEVWSRGTLYSEPAPVKFADGPLRTGADGSFRSPECLLSGLLYRVVVRPEGIEPLLSEWVEVAPGSGTEAMRVTLHPLLEVSGRVVDRQGHPLSGATVLQSGDGPERTSTTADEDGRFRLPGFGQGPVYVFARADGFRFQGQRLDQAADGVEIVMTRVNETPTVSMTTLDLPISAEQRKALAHRLLDPYLEKVLPSKADGGKFWALRSLLYIDPVEALGALERTTIELPGGSAMIRGESAFALAKADPDEAEAVVESIDDLNQRLRALAALWESLPDTEQERKRALIEKAVPVVGTLTDTSRQVGYFGRIADGLIDLGDTESARSFLERGKTAAVAAIDKTGSGRGALVAALSRVDLPAALAMVEEVQDKDEKGRLLRNIAARRAKTDPAGAERVLNLIDDPADWGRASERICRDVAATDPAVARRIVEALPRGYKRAWALVYLAFGLKDQDRDGAMDAVREAMGEFDWMAAHESSASSPSPLTADVLPIVEAVDPALVPEVFWRSLAFRAPGYDARLLVGVNPQATLALLVSRYDRQIAADLLAPVLGFSRRHPEDPDSDIPSTVLTLGMIDPVEAVEFVEAMPAEPVEALHGSNWSRIILSKALAQSKESRWHNLWRSFTGLGGVRDEGDIR